MGQRSKQLKHLNKIAAGRAAAGLPDNGEVVGTPALENQTPDSGGDDVETDSGGDDVETEQYSGEEDGLCSGLEPFPPGDFYTYQRGCSLMLYDIMQLTVMNLEEDEENFRFQNFCNDLKKGDARNVTHRNTNVSVTTVL